MKTHRLVLILTGAAVLAGIVIGFLPKPVPVESAAVTRGTLVVSVRDDGRTRIRDRYVVSAPVAGRLLRIPLKPGDAVEADATPVATLVPSDPDLLDDRARARLAAGVGAAEAGLEQARALHSRALASLAFARSDKERVSGLFGTSTLARQELDRSESLLQTAEAEVAAAHFAVQIASFELEQARVAAAQAAAPGPPPPARLTILAPASGQVLRVFQESETVVQPGNALLEIGNPTHLEVEIDVLSSDAVTIPAHARVLFEHWGGATPLEGRVRRVEPAGFTKVSTLGVEEQRVWVIADILSPHDRWQGLGDGFRVEARIVAHEEPDALLVPLSALFLTPDGWAAFVAAGSRARLRPVTPGHFGEDAVGIRSGLSEGDRVIVHPGDRLHDNARIRERNDR